MRSAGGGFAAVSQRFRSRSCFAAEFRTGVVEQENRSVVEQENRSVSGDHTSGDSDNSDERAGSLGDA